MKTLLVLAAVIALAGLSASQTMKAASTHRRAVDSRCSQLRLQSNSAMPSYNGQGFSTVSYSDPDEPFIVPAGCFQFSCARHGKMYRVLSCPNLTLKSFSRTMDTSESLGSTRTVNSVPGSVGAVEK
jgi:hypothetical protein